jgi:hypothetical protein
MRGNLEKMFIPLEELPLIQENYQNLHLEISKESQLRDVEF